MVAFFTKEGIRSRSGKLLHLSRISSILSNPFYCGFFRYNGEIYEGKHKSLITKKLFDRVQEVLKLRGKPHSKINEPSPLCGLLRCGTCHMMVTAENRIKKQKNGNTHHYVYYRCTRKSKTIKCLEQPIRDHYLNEQLSELLKPFILPKEWAEVMLMMADKDQQNCNRLVITATQEMRSKVDGIIRKQELLFQGYLAEDVEPEKYRLEKNKLTLEKRTLTEQITHLEHSQGTWIEPLRNLIKDAEKLGEITLSPELHPKKFFAQKIFGLNLFLKNGRIDSTPQTQWAAIEAAHNLVGKLPLSLILECRYNLARTYSTKNL